MVRADSKLSVLILSGSPIIGSFDFAERVDFVRIPGVVKLQNGEYTSLKLPMAVDETVALRAAIIERTAAAFDPDVFIVDKEPHGLRGEVLETLHMLKARGTTLVLGLRDIVDDPQLLGPEWNGKGVVPTLESLYDEIWVYGLPQIVDPLDDLGLPASVRRKMVYTGYLRRKLPAGINQGALPFGGRPFVLVTAGGGGDGAAMFDWVLRAYEADRGLPLPAFFVLGPFLDPEVQVSLNERIARLDNVESIVFDSHPEWLITAAVGIVAMGGYNTFCEILSFDKRAVLVPRTKPRREQFIRAARTQTFGLVRMLVPEPMVADDEMTADWRAMATALRHLPQQRRPSEVVLPGLLAGLESVNRLVALAIGRRRGRGVRLARRDDGEATRGGRGR